MSERETITVRIKEKKRAMSCRNLCSALFLVLIVVSCAVLWVLHSLYFILRYAEPTEKEEYKNVREDQLHMPALVICNRMPFSQDGIGSVSSQLRQDYAIRYLREWTNPTMRESADFVAQTSDQAANAMDLINRNLPQQTRRQQIANMMYQCQSMINSCSFQGQTMSSYQCCQNAATLIPSLNGQCIAFQDQQLWLNSTGYNKQFVITFQVPRNSWYSSTAMTMHPGIDIYMEENIDDVIRIAADLGTPITLADKEGVRLRMRKERRADTRRSACGVTVGNSRSADQSAVKNNKTNLLPCLLQTAIDNCNCHPLMAELLPLDQTRMQQFYSRVANTQVCSVEQYDNCARRYVEFARPANFIEDVPRDMLNAAAVEKCRSDNHEQCLRTTFPGALDRYPLPSDYQSTNDYVSRLSLEYTSMKVREVTVSKDPNLYEMLSYVGYNLALWFCVAHILWSGFTLARDAMCGNGKVAPAERKAFLTTVTVPPPAQQTSEAKIEIEETPVAD